MRANTSNGFSIWAQSEVTYIYLRENYPDLPDDSPEMKQLLVTLWKKLPLSDKKYWQQQMSRVSNDWMKTDAVKRCGTPYKWETGTVMVTRCQQDGLWYLADEHYCQGTHVVGDWPQTNGRDVPQSEVDIKVKWTDDGLQLSFKHQVSDADVKND
jgi:hypothetical protein